MYVTITRTIRQLAREEGAWVGIARLRAALPDTDPETLDKWLIHMNRKRRLVLNPEMNQKALSETDWDAAVIVGDTPNHLVALLN